MGKMCEMQNHSKQCCAKIVFGCQFCVMAHFFFKKRRRHVKNMCLSTEYGPMKGLTSQIAKLYKQDRPLFSSLQQRLDVAHRRAMSG